jgi:heme/copper-type cytochrome/quinol oxidase subunit 3
MGAGATPPPRSVTARTAEAAAAVARQRVAQPNGWWGMALFLCAEVALFGTLISSYFYLDFGAKGWPPAPIQPPGVVAPLVIMACLAATSVPMALSVRAARRAETARVIWLIMFAVAIQLGYLVVNIDLLAGDLRKFLPSGSAYGSIYYTLLVAHDAHVLLGLLLSLGIVYRILARGLTNYWLIGVRGVALYWHVVNALAIFVVLTQLSPSL